MTAKKVKSDMDEAKAGGGSPLPGAINFGPGMDAEGNPEQAKDIHGAIVAIMEQVGYVRKSRGANLTYAYAGEAALIAALRPWMAYFRVYMTVTDITDVSDEGTPRVNQQGQTYGMSHRVTLTSRVRFTHAPSGTWVDVAARGEASNVSDKASYAAGTGAYKYALRQTFCIETGEDPDDHTPLVPARSSTGPLYTEAGGAGGGLSPRDPAYIGGDFDQTPPGSPEAPEPPPPEEEFEAGTTGAALGADVRPPAGPPPSRLAKLDMDKDDKDWRQWLARLIKKYPDYSVQKDKHGTEIADLSHLRATAMSLGHPVIGPATYQAVLTAIAKHAGDKAALYGQAEAEVKAGAAKADPVKAPTKPAPAPGKAQAGGAAKRPSNDEALRKAGF